MGIGFEGREGEGMKRPLVITYKQLVEQQVCLTARRQFKRAFGLRVYFTAENIAKAKKKSPYLYERPWWMLGFLPVGKISEAAARENRVLRDKFLAKLITSEQYYEQAWKVMLKYSTKEA